MELSIKGKQLDTCNALTQHIKTRLTDSVEKYFDHALEPNAVLTKEGSGKQFRTDIIVHIARNIKMHGRATTEEPCAVFGTALERAAKQLRRYKRQLNDHRKKHRVLQPSKRKNMSLRTIPTKVKSPVLTEHP